MRCHVVAQYMRTLTRNILLIIGLVSVGLLSLGALPGYLGSGNPYHLTVEPVDADRPAVDVSAVSERRYPFLISALTAPDRRSMSYQTGSYGVKEQFTHTPFDEVDALERREPAAVQADGVRILYEGERYYVEVVQQRS